MVDRSPRGEWPQLILSLHPKASPGSGRRRLAACSQNTDSRLLAKGIEKVCVEELTDLNS